MAKYCWNLVLYTKHINKLDRKKIISLFFYYFVASLFIFVFSLLFAYIFLFTSFFATMKNASRFKILPFPCKNYFLMKINFCVCLLLYVCYCILLLLTYYMDKELYVNVKIFTMFLILFRAIQKIKIKIIWEVCVYCNVVVLNWTLDYLRGTSLTQTRHKNYLSG